MAKSVILCVDDEKTVLTSLKQELEYGLGGEYAVEIAESGEEGLEVMEDLMHLGIDVPVIISDQLMPGMKGDEFLVAVNKINDVSRKILLTGQASADAVGNAVNQANLYRYISKPWEETDLRMTVEEAVRSFFLNQSLNNKVATLQNLNLHAERLAQHVDPAGLIRTFLTHMLPDLGATRGAVCLFPEQGEPWWIVGMQQGEDQDFQEGRGTIPEGAVARGVLEAVREKPEVLNIPNAFKVGAFVEEPTVKARKCRSIYVAPIIGDGRLLSLIYFEHEKKFRFFGPEKQEFLGLVQKQATSAFENSLLYHHLEQKIEERTATIRLMNRELENSIHYASRLQQAILPSLEVMGNFVKDAFVLFKPKDIVSGDFYWVAPVQDCLVMAAVDCTGHGVPGAFMTVLGYSSLNSIVLDGEVLDPAAILSALDRRVRETLHQDEADAVQQDGMDMAICVYRPLSRELRFAGAMNPLCRIRNAELEEFKGEKYPIGGGGYGEKNFVTHVLEVQAGDQYYMFSDGYTDQFGGGGPRLKRFGKRRLKTSLLELEMAEMQIQKERLDALYASHRGEEEQLDDVLLMGFKI